MNKDELVTTLIAQHRLLQADLLSALKKTQTELNGNKKNISAEILSDFQKFGKDLTEHLTLENGTFYVDYLDKQRKAGFDTNKTEKFIEEMSIISASVHKFLEKYNITEKIEKTFTNFSAELQVIINTLNLRIETEEESVYEFYLLM